MMKLGLMFVNSGPFTNPALLAHLATTAEKCGIESMWTVEHVVIPQDDYKSPYPYSSSGKIPGGEDVSIPDPLLRLAFAGRGDQGLSACDRVLILPAAASAVRRQGDRDRSTSCRTGARSLGSAVDGSKKSFTSLGLDFHTRGARTDEAIKSLRALWSENAATFHGKHFNSGRSNVFRSRCRKLGCRFILVDIRGGGQACGTVWRWILPGAAEIPS